MKNFSFFFLMIGFLFSNSSLFAQSTTSCSSSNATFNVQAGNNEVTITGGSVNKLITISTTWQYVTVCDNGDGDPNNDCSSSGVISVAAGDYNQLQIFDSGWDNCTTGSITISSGSGGSGTDADGDGVTVEDGDCDDADSNVTTYGAPCNDGVTSTINDYVNGSCDCVGYFVNNVNSTPFSDLIVGEVCDNNGTVIKTDDVLTLSISPQGTNLSSTYHINDGAGNLLADNISYGTPYQMIFPQTGGSFALEIRDGSSTSYSGNYILWAYPANSIDSELFDVNGCPCTDSDSDGVCDDVDCDPNDSNITTMLQPVGTPCDDGNSNTSGEVIQADGCTCSGGTGGGNNSTLWAEGFNGIYTDSKAMVNDTLLAKKIIVQTDVFADYVFDINYPLLPLKELETYIQENKHLPNIPAAAEVIEKGINVSEMSVKHMEKIEELTLYILQINKRLEQVEKENKRLKKVLKKRK